MEELIISAGCDKLCKILERKNMIKTELIRDAEIKMQCQDLIRMKMFVSLVKMRAYLDCMIDDIMEMIPMEAINK